MVFTPCRHQGMFLLHPPHDLVITEPSRVLMCTVAGTGGGRFDSAHGTHACFGARGDRVIVTYHGDHAYSFDVTAAGGDPVAVYGGSCVPPGAARC